MAKWQPVMLVLANHRLECKCGRLAVFVTGEVPDSDDVYSSLEQVECWCQDCYQQAQQEPDDD
jgi:hypothetical protein